MRRSKYIIKPSEEIFYTKGEEYSLDGVNYIGPYHIEESNPYTNGPESNDKKLLRKYYQSSSNYTYDRVFKFDKVESTYKEPMEVRPIPNESDYQTGFMQRFFVQKLLDLTIFPYEIDYNQAGLYGQPDGIDAGRYALIEIQWKLTGNLVTLQKGNAKQIGIAEWNETQINTAAAMYPLMRYAVRSFTEFANVTLF